jgi:hypothetical protein
VASGLPKPAEKLFQNFKDHLAKLLNRTISAVPLQEIRLGNRRLLQFSVRGAPVCVPVGNKGYHLFIGQTIEVAKEKGDYRLRTLRYEYRVTAGSDFDAPALVRWEYNSREFRTSLFPRHHIQIQAKVESFAGGVLDLNKIHLPSGWITVEEVVRFLITELKVKPFSDDWDDLLQKSEQKFREWTRRSI